MAGVRQGCALSSNIFVLTTDCRHRLPIPFPICQAMFVQCLLRCFITDATDGPVWLSLAGLLRLGVFGLLRPIEFEALRRKHIFYLKHGLASILKSLFLLQILKPKGTLEIPSLRSSTTQSPLHGLPTDLRASTPTTICFLGVSRVWAAPLISSWATLAGRGWYSRGEALEESLTF